MDAFASGVNNVITIMPGGLNTIQLVVFLLASKYALRSRFLELIFSNPICSAVLLWMSAFIAFDNNILMATYVSVGLWVLDIIMNAFFPRAEGFDIENRDIYGGCMNMTYEQILDSFGGDKERLRRAMFNAVNTNYASAPLAATQLVNKGWYLGEDCKIN